MINCYYAYRVFLASYRDTHYIKYTAQLCYNKITHFSNSNPIKIQYQRWANRSSNTCISPCMYMYAACKMIEIQSLYTRPSFCNFTQVDSTCFIPNRSKCQTRDVLERRQCIHVDVSTYLTAVHLLADSIFGTHCWLTNALMSREWGRIALYTYIQTKEAESESKTDRYSERERIKKKRKKGER